MFANDHVTQKPWQFPLFLKSFLFFSGLSICSSLAYHTGVFKLSHVIFESSLGSKYVTTKSAVCIFGWLTGNIIETCAVVMGLMQFLGIWHNNLEISLFYCESELVWEKGRVSCWIDSTVWVILKPPASWHWHCFKWHNVQLLPPFWHSQWLSSNHTCYLPFIHHFCSDSLLVQKINLKAYLLVWYFLFLDPIQIYIIARFRHFLFLNSTKSQMFCGLLHPLD